MLLYRLLQFQQPAGGYSAHYSEREIIIIFRLKCVPHAFGKTEDLYLKFVKYLPMYIKIRTWARKPIRCEITNVVLITNLIMYICTIKNVSIALFLFTRIFFWAHYHNLKFIATFRFNRAILR